MSRSYEDSALGYLRNYMKIAREVKKIIENIDSDARVYVFGSVVRGKVHSGKRHRHTRRNGEGRRKV